MIYDRNAGESHSRKVRLESPYEFAFSPLEKIWLRPETGLLLRTFSIGQQSYLSSMCLRRKFSKVPVDCSISLSGEGLWPLGLRLGFGYRESEFGGQDGPRVRTLPSSFRPRDGDSETWLTEAVGNCIYTVDNRRTVVRPSRGRISDPVASRNVTARHGKRHVYFGTETMRPPSRRGHKSPWPCESIGLGYAGH